MSLNLLKVGSKIRIIRNKRNQKNKFHIKYQNAVGQILSKQGKSFKVKVCFSKKIFTPIISEDQLFELI